MSKITLGMAILLASCSFAMADDEERCEKLMNDDGKVVAYLCPYPTETVAPKCHYYSKDRLLCIGGEIGGPVPRDRVVPRGWDRKRGKLR